jgi:hypothetical protein
MGCARLVITATCIAALGISRAAIALTVFASTDTRFTAASAIWAAGFTGTNLRFDRQT